MGEITVMNCSTCSHKWLHDAIVNGTPLGYAGPIPCKGCSRFEWKTDNWSPARANTAKEFNDALMNEWGWKPYPSLNVTCKSCNFVLTQIPRDLTEITANNLRFMKCPKCGGEP